MLEINIYFLRGGVVSNPKNFIANLRNLAHIYELSQKKAQCNFQKVTGGGQGRLGIFSKIQGRLGNSKKWRGGGVRAVWGFYKAVWGFYKKNIHISE